MILVIVALVVFICNFAGGNRIGYDGSQPLLRLGSLIIISFAAPAQLLGLAAIIHYLRLRPRN